MRPQPERRGYRDGHSDIDAAKESTKTYEEVTAPIAERKFAGSCRLFIEPLNGTNVTEEALKELFQPFGEVSEVFLNPSKVFALLKMDTRLNAETAKTKLDGSNFRGKTIKVRFAQNTFALWVGDLHPSVTNEILGHAFQQFGEIDRAVVACDDKGKSLCWGIVEFARKQTVAMAMDRCNREPFLISRTPKPVRVQTLFQTDTRDGVASQPLERISNTTLFELNVEARFPTPGTREHDLAMKWRALKAQHIKEKMDMKERQRQEVAALEADMAMLVKIIELDRKLPEPQYPEQQQPAPVGGYPPYGADQGGYPPSSGTPGGYSSQQTAGYPPQTQPQQGGYTSAPSHFGTLPSGAGLPQGMGQGGMTQGNYPPYGSQNQSFATSQPQSGMYAQAQGQLYTPQQAAGYPYVAVPPKQAPYQYASYPDSQSSGGYPPSSTLPGYGQAPTPAAPAPATHTGPLGYGPSDPSSAHMGPGMGMGMGAPAGGMGMGMGMGMGLGGASYPPQTGASYPGQPSGMESAPSGFGPGAGVGMGAAAAGYGGVRGGPTGGVSAGGMGMSSGREDRYGGSGGRDRDRDYRDSGRESSGRSSGFDRDRSDRDGDRRDSRDSRDRRDSFGKGGDRRSSQDRY